MLMFTQPRRKCAKETLVASTFFNRCRPVILFFFLSFRVGLIPLLSQSQRGGEKDQNLPLTVLFPPHSPPPLSCLQSLSFNIHYKHVTGYRRVERGEQCVVTLQLQAPGPGSLSQKAVERRVGGVHPLVTPRSLPTNPTTRRINRPATPYKRCGGVHASSGGTPAAATGLLREQSWRRDVQKSQITTKISTRTFLFYFFWHVGLFQLSMKGIGWSYKQ